nr:HD domain-containing protein [uncultured Lachnoclostridium sp.]
MGTKELDTTTERVPSFRLILTALTLLFTSLVLTIGFGVLLKINLIQLMKYVIYTIVANFIIGFYLYQNQKDVLRKKYSWWLISFCYLITVGSVILLKLPNILVFNNRIDILDFPVWLLGIAILALFIDTNLAIFLSFGMAMFTYAGNTTYEVLLITLILSLDLCILAKYLTRWISFLYAVLVTLSLYITMLVTKNDFSLNELFTEKNIGYYTCVFVILLLSFVSGSIVNYISNKKVRKEIHFIDNNSEFATSLEECNEATTREVHMDLSSIALDTKELEEGFLQQAGLQEVKNTFTIQEVANLRFPLMKRLEEESPKLYIHSKSIAYLSQKAAECIGAKEDVAFVGGLYHEIGRLLGADYVKNGEELAIQYKLPKEVSDMIRQHNFKVELPKTKEAAIVMLSDNILSTILYLKNSGETSITAEKVIENTFSIRLNKGTLDESGISLKEFHKLKEFYIMQYAG